MTAQNTLAVYNLPILRHLWDGSEEQRVRLPISERHRISAVTDHYCVEVL